MRHYSDMKSRGGSQLRMRSIRYKPGDREQRVRRPGRHDRRQEIDVAELVEQQSDREINHRDADADAYSGHRAPVPDQESERHRDQGHDQGEDRNGEFLVVLYVQLDGIEAALLQLFHICGELGVIHLLIELDRLQEVIGRLEDLGEGGGCEVSDLVFVDSADISRYALLPYPRADVRLPSRAAGADFPDQVESPGIELKHVGLDHDFLGRVEVLHIEDAVIVNDPAAFGMKISLARAAFDLIQDGVLDLVGLRNVRIIEGEQKQRSVRRSSAKRAARAAVR